MYKRIFSKLLFGFLFCMCMLCVQKNNVQAGVYLDIENTLITDKNAVISAMISTGKQPMDSITIIVKKNGEEIKTKRIEVNTYESARYTFDFQKDLGIILEKDCLYEYIISQQRPFSEERDAFGQFYTGEDVYVTVCTTVLDSSDGTENILSTECILGVTLGEKFHYVAEWEHPKYSEYIKSELNVEFMDDLPCEYEIEVLEDPSKNVIKNQYYYSVNPTGVFKIGGYYIKDSDNKKRIDTGVFLCPVHTGKVYVPEDIIEINGQYYMYDATATTTELYVDMYRPFYQNVYDIYYKKCESPTTQTSATVNFINAETGKQLYQKNISNLTVGEAFTYTPENTYADSENSYVYSSDSANNVLTIDKLWTNPENNVLTVYYKVDSSESEQPKKVVNPLKKEKPVIKKANWKNKTTAKLKFSKVKKAQGYEICYSTKKSFKKSVTKRVKKNTITLKNLKKRKVYYVKVRGYRKIDGEIFYSKYSKVKRI